MILTANYQLLDLFMDYMTPSQMMEIVQNATIRRVSVFTARLSYMLHLSPRVASLWNGKYVSKCSIQFRDWMFLKLGSANHAITNRKLISYYFDNLVNQQYFETDLVINEVPLGLGQRHGPKILNLEIAEEQDSKEEDGDVDGNGEGNDGEEKTEEHGDEEEVGDFSSKGGIKRGREDDGDDGPERKKRRTDDDVDPDALD